MSDSTAPKFQGILQIIVELARIGIEQVFT